MSTLTLEALVETMRSCPRPPWTSVDGVTLRLSEWVPRGEVYAMRVDPVVIAAIGGNTTKLTLMHPKDRETFVDISDRELAQMIWHHAMKLREEQERLSP